MAIPYEKIVAEDLNLGSGTVPVTMPAGGSMSGTQINERTFGIIRYNVRTYGAVGDGQSDDTQALVSAIAAASGAGGGMVWIPNGTYRLTTQVNLNVGHVALQGESRAGAILQWDDLPTSGLMIDTSLVDPAISVLTIDGASGARTITVADGTKFPVNAWVFIQDVGGNSHNGSLMTRVHSVATNVLTLEDALPQLFAVADGATAYCYVNHPLLEGLVFRDLTLACAAVVPTQFLTLLTIFRGAHFTIERCTFRGSTQPLIAIVGGYGGTIANCAFQNGVTVASAGLSVQTHTGISLVNCFIEMCQFGATFSASPYSRAVGNRVNGRQTVIGLGRGLRFGQGSHFGVASGNTVSECNLYGIYFEDSSYCSATGNTVSFCGVDAGEHGIVSGGYVPTVLALHNTIVGNTVRAVSGYGIAFLGYFGPAYGVVVGNAVSGCVWGAVFCDASYCVFSENALSGPAATVVGGILKIGNGGDFNTIVGNVFVADDGGATFAINTASGGGHNILDDNALGSTVTLALHAGDTTGTTDAGMAAYVTARLPAVNLNTHTSVATNADTLETTAWSFVIPANTLTVAGQGFRLTGVVTVAANANAKTIRVKVGTATFVGNIDVGTGAVTNVKFEVEAFWVSSIALQAWGTFLTSRLGPTLYEPGLSFTIVANDLTLDLPIVVTLQNGAASAGDLTFQLGKLTYEGVAHG